MTFHFLAFWQDFNLFILLIIIVHKLLGGEWMIVTVDVFIFKYVIKYWLPVFNFYLTFTDNEIICRAQEAFLDVRHPRKILGTAWFMRWLILNQFILNVLIFTCSIDSFSLWISWMLARSFYSIFNFYFIF